MENKKKERLFYCSPLLLLFFFFCSPLLKILDLGLQKQDFLNVVPITEVGVTMPSAFLPAPIDQDFVASFSFHSWLTRFERGGRAFLVAVLFLNNKYLL